MKLNVDETIFRESLQAATKLTAEYVEAREALRRTGSIKPMLDNIHERLRVIERFIFSLNPE